ncbi:unnamed protein product [Pocillopora meandrina]|uniref:LIM zinc-binding domain-containing protein n=1 Tax=Pocillopora meandrina TaxID=46732 RepID=A0AAU9XAC0_9CNID|nr:unnamed protein product [Pocillopora meandrina]
MSWLFFPSNSSRYLLWKKEDFRKCPTCNKDVFFAEKVSSLGKDWHRGCLKCTRCGKTLTSGGHAEPMKCIAETNRDLFTGGFSRASISLRVSTLKQQESIWIMSRKCPTCEKTVYMGEKKESVGNWYHPLCLKCKKCGRQLAKGNHAEPRFRFDANSIQKCLKVRSCLYMILDVRKGQPYCHNPCYASEFGPGGFGHGGTESHKY